MNIGIDIRHLASNALSGIGQYTTHVVQEMAAQYPEHSFTLFATGSKKTLLKLPVFKQTNIKIFKYQSPNKVVNAKNIFLKKPIESYLNVVPDVWWFPNLCIANTKLPYAITLHDASFKIFPEFFTRKSLAWHKLSMMQDKLQKAGIVLAVSQKTKIDGALLFNLNKKNIHVSHLGVNDVYNPKQHPSDKTFLRDMGINSPYILFLSTIEPRKNLKNLIYAYEESSKNNLDIPKLIIAGGNGWKSKEVLKLIKNHPLKKNIQLLGYVEEKHKPALYRNATMLVAPSFYEGFGLPVLESMACGTPVITSFSGGLPEVVGDSAIMVDPYNISDISSAINLLLSDAELQLLLRNKGLVRAQNFTWQKTAKVTMEALISLV
ncbi:glycosyltransferase family 4 protein [Patescibacteria group bacterium]|nr:glycosyltransferase family 4 protein [Patescibacteria group bacterium]